MEQPVILNEVTCEIKEKLRKSFSLTIFVGAGISLSSGIATFRGAGKEKYFQGAYNPSYLSSRQGFAQYPKIAWQYFKHTYELVKNTNPNIAHQTLVTWQKEIMRHKKLYLLTTNYDGLINKAGGQAAELHGNINEAICSSCQQIYLMEKLNLNALPPLCNCGNILIPNIVLLNFLIKKEHYELALTATRGSSTYIAIGTSGVTNHSYGFMKAIKLRPNTTLIEINPRPSHLTKDMNYVIRGKAEDIMPQFN